MSFNPKPITFPAKVLFCADVKDITSISEVTIYGSSGDYYKGAGREDYYMKGSCYPLAAREELIAMVTEIQRLYKLADDSISMVYQLRNKIARGEITWE